MCLYRIKSPAPNTLGGMVASTQIFCFGTFYIFIEGRVITAPNVSVAQLSVVHVVYAYSNLGLNAQGVPG